MVQRSNVDRDVFLKSLAYLFINETKDFILFTTVIIAILLVDIQKMQFLKKRRKKHHNSELLAAAAEMDNSV